MAPTRRRPPPGSAKRSTFCAICERRVVRRDDETLEAAVDRHVERKHSQLTLFPA